MNRVRFEWVIEETQRADSTEWEAGEIVDVNHANTYAEALTLARDPDDGTEYRIALVRDDADNRRAWAYTVGGALPEYFVDAWSDPTHKVPARFRAEVARASA